MDLTFKKDSLRVRFSKKEASMLLEEKQFVFSFKSGLKASIFLGEESLYFENNQLSLSVGLEQQQAFDPEKPSLQGVQYQINGVKVVLQIDIKKEKI